MVHVRMRHFILKLQSHRGKCIVDMGWICVVWLLCLSVRESWQLPNSEPVIHGEIQSPQYPRPYSPNLLKKWDLWVPEGYQIQLSLTHLDIKASSGCRQDSLTVHYDQKVLGKFCGQKNSTDHLREKSVLSKSNKLTLVFQTSNSTPELQQHIGFSATYEAIDMDECLKLDPGNDTGPLCSQICINTPGSYHCSCYYGYQLHSDQRTCLISCGGHMHDKHKGHLSSPRFPHPSPPFLSCKYIISVEPRFTVTLNFSDNFHIEIMDTEHGPRCLHHWLQVTIPDKTPTRLCGGKSPGLIATNSNTVTLDYHTDSEGLSHGWSLDYSTNVVEICGDPEPLPNGGVTFLSGFQNQYRSVVQYYCNEPFYSLPEGKNVSFTCEANRKWRSKHSDITPTCIPVCGKPTKLISAYQRIIGGREAPDNTIPWQVLLSVHRIRGGGMVIADRWILTAAHDLTHNGKPASVEAVRIYMGFTDVKTLLRSRVYAASIHIHPEYNNPNGLDFNNDIALIKLQDPITFNSSIMPICLPAEDARYITDMMGLVSGFGIMAIYPPQITKKLKYVQIPVVEQETCRKSISELKKTREDIPRLTNNMFCAGVPEGGKDSCLGDNGGPFALKDDGQFWAAGIVSWGIDCGQQGTYRVFTKVAHYLDWINKTMWEN